VAPRPPAEPPWATWSSERLLELRLCDLDLQLRGSWIEGCLQRVHAELAARGLRVRPHAWLSDEWFSPDGVPGVAVPFYLAHPRLMRLERELMLEVEGGSRESCLRLLRHETGHAVQHAYALHRRRRWQRVFGLSSTPYPDYYRPNPSSRDHVVHLDAWYAQAHPDEDFAETFAVWLAPRATWRRTYAGWPALAKLEYVDALMDELRGAPLERRTRQCIDPLSRLRRTLAEHYAIKRSRYAVGSGEAYDHDLLRLFGDIAAQRGEGAATFVRRHHRELREIVAHATGEHRFTLDQVLREVAARCRELGLRVGRSERQAKLDLALVITMHTARKRYRGRELHAV
jgi:hypothetical protein